MDPNLDGRLRAIEAKLDSIESRVVKIRKVQKAGGTARLVYWAFIILLGLGAFYFVQPYIDQLKSIYNFGDNNDFQNFDALVKQFKGQDQ